MMDDEHQQKGIEKNFNKINTTNGYSRDAYQTEQRETCSPLGVAKTAGSTRTSYNYVNMIVECILASDEKKVLLSDIYKFVQKNYREMIDKGVDWQNGIRHNLSLNDCFLKESRNPNGKGYYWKIAPKNIEYFKQGDFRRRWAQCRTRRHRSKSDPARQQLANQGVVANQHIQPNFMFHMSGNDHAIYDRNRISSLSAEQASVFEQHQCFSYEQQFPRGQYYDHRQYFRVPDPSQYTACPAPAVYGEQFQRMPYIPGVGQAPMPQSFVTHNQNVQQNYGYFERTKGGGDIDQFVDERTQSTPTKKHKSWGMDYILKK